MLRFQGTVSHINIGGLGMSKSGIGQSILTSVVTVACLALMAQAAQAQSPQPLPQPNDPAPVRPQGLLTQYYNDTVALGTGCPAPPGSVLTPTSATATLAAMQLEGSVNSAVVTPGRPAAVNDDNIYGRWSGFVTTTVAGDYVISMRVDDGGRVWFNQNPLTITPNIVSWQGQGPTTYNATFTGLAAATRYPITFEWFEGGVTQFAGLLWTPPAGTSVAIPLNNLTPPDGPAAPTLTVNSPIGPPPPLVNLSWTTPAGATGYIVSRSTTSAAAGFTVLAIVAGTTYVDNAVAFGTQYWYMVQATSTNGLLVGPESTVQTATPILPAITVTPSTGLQTNENGATAVATITFNQALLTGQSVNFTITSSDAGEGVVSSSGQGPAGSIGFTVNGPVAVNATIPLVITGIDDAIVDNVQNYTITIATTGQFGAVFIPALQCANNDNDVPGITISATAGLLTSESGGTASFSIQLNTQPTNSVTINLTSGNVLEGTVSPATLTFTNVGGQAYSAITGSGGWNVPHVVTVTGVDDALLDFTVPYAIVTGNSTSADPNYNGIVVSDVACNNLDNEVPPELPRVWGSAGCGLLGLELAIPALLALGLRRRHRRT